MLGQQAKKQTIGIDSLALALKINESDLKLLLMDMEALGLVSLEESKTQSRRMTRSGSVGIKDAGRTNYSDGSIAEV